LSKGDFLTEICENNPADSPRVIFLRKVSMQKTHDIMPTASILPKLDFNKVLSKTPTSKLKPTEEAPKGGILKNINATLLKKFNVQEKELVLKIESLTKELITSNHKIEELKNKLEKYKRNYKELKSKTNKLKENLKLANNKIEILKMQIKKLEKNKPLIQLEVIEDSFNDLDESSISITDSKYETVIK
jgi:hypothetical protein